MHYLCSWENFYSYFRLCKSLLINYIYVLFPLTWVLFQVPNPLFDLAGIMCGQFGIPFWEFFLATLIGKAIIKTHIQVCRVPLAKQFTPCVSALD